MKKNSATAEITTPALIALWCAEEVARPILRRGVQIRRRRDDRPANPIEHQDYETMPVAAPYSRSGRRSCTLLSMIPGRGDPIRENLVMRAMVLDEPGRPLIERELPEPEPGDGQVLIEVSACGVCRTDLHIVDGELTEPKLPLVLGHQIVGRVVGGGEGRGSFRRRGPGRRARGSAGPTGPVATAAPVARTSASTRSSRATTSTVATPSGSWPTSASRSRCRATLRTITPRLCSAPA